MGPGRLKGHRMMGDEDLNLVKTFSHWPEPVGSESSFYLLRTPPGFILITLG